MEGNNQEELDLKNVYTGMKNAIVHFVGLIIWVITFSFQKALYLSIFILLFTGIFASIYFLQKPFYKSTMSISHIRFENEYCYEMIKDLNSYIDGKTNSGLATALKISPEDAVNIKSIHYFPMNDNVAKRYSDSTKILLPFKVEVEVYNNDVLDTLETGIINYLESNEFATKTKEIERISLEENKKRILQEIAALDSLKRIVDQSIIPRSSGNGIILGEPIDPVAVYKRGMEMYEKEIMINSAQKLLNTFDIRVGFSKSYKTANVSIIIYILFGALFGYCIGFYWVLNREKNK